jgi:AraC family transcriptional regulator of adaptative response / DNA-3-methyladenine glycosylase II
MHLDPDACYQAVLSRDPRFDGRFFTGVVSTGIYCRPVCPARTPRRENVRFFSCAAAAEEAGFRACMRCRPETAPGTPAWAGSSATVSRALRLISDGFLDTGCVEDLALALGVGARHLRRLFDEHLGASPTSVASTRRVHFARQLLDETSLSVTEIAYSSGFSSVRRFNDAFRAVFALSPSETRRERAHGGPGAVLSLRLPFRPPMQWDALIGFLRARAVAGVESVGTAYRRTVEVDGVVGTIDVRMASDGDCLTLAVPAALARSLPRVVERVRRIFDLSADPAQIEARLSGDPELARELARRPGLRVPGAWDGFETAVRAVVGQQVSVSGATTVLGRIARRYGGPVDSGDASLDRLFPPPERLARAGLGGVGLTRARARTIRALAAAVLRGEVDFRRAASLDDIVASLVRIDGVGPWTGHYIAMRAHGDPDAFPAGDLVLRRAARRIAGVQGDGELARRAARWRPWRAYAAMHLWMSEAERKDTIR